MSASDSDLSEASKTPAPPDHELEKALRRAVIKAQKDEPDFTLKSIRTAAETKLGLTPGFYKAHAVWNLRSKDIINDQIESAPEAQSSPPKPAPKPSKKEVPKRKSSQKAAAPSKRQKTVKQDENLSDNISSSLSDAPSDFDEEKSKKKQRNAPAKSLNTKSKPVQAKQPKRSEKAKPHGKGGKEQNGGAGADSDDAEEEAKPARNTADTSESELSVLDDEPAPKKKSKRRDSSGAKPKKATTKSSAKSKPDSEDPDVAEIKRLQGWLVKCGIRKVWGKELKPYDTSRAKIKHLKDMLAVVGMTGRYSIDKANQIKEARELAADIEAVQEGAERWGADEDDSGSGADNDGAKAPARRLVRGAKNYDFLSSDGEETD